MTTTYDPTHSEYVDQLDVRAELTRVFDVCAECRACTGLCPSFTTLFDLLDRHQPHDAGLLTPAQQDQVVDQCFQCTRCFVGCPHVPGLHELEVDFPRLVLRAAAMQRANGITTFRERTATQLLGRADLVGRLDTRMSAGANKLVAARPGSLRRRALATATGLSSRRLLAPYASQRFSTWFARRPIVELAGHQERVTVFPSCVVEYKAVGVGKDLVRVFERNGVECALTDAGCCGAPWLHAGNVEAFSKVAARNLAALAEEVRSGTDIVVPQPSCAAVIRDHYPRYVDGPDGELVAAHTYEATEFLVRMHQSADRALDTDFHGDVVGSIAHHAPVGRREHHASVPSRDLMRLTGARVTLVRQPSATDGKWGLRASNDHIAVPIAAQLGVRIDAAGCDLVTGDCPLANTAIEEQTGRRPVHPLQVVARAYGISPEA